MMEMDGNGWKWMEMDGNGWKWMDMDGNGWIWMDLGDSPSSSKSCLVNSLLSSFWKTGF